MKKRLIAALTLAAMAPAIAHEAEPALPRCLAFPDAADGRKLLAVDLHTHSAFSDGHVWPTVRVWESDRDCLFAMAVTEHLEWQPHAEDIPHPDRNRSLAVAREAVERSRGDISLLLIPGAEITRFYPPGHINAIFIDDANPLLFDRGAPGKPKLEESRKAIDAAKAQNAFLFWNHPAWTRDFPTGGLDIGDFHKKLIRDKKLHGIEVANGQFYSEEALAVALDYDLAILGTSDIHGLIDWDYDIAGGGHRTTTLVLTREATLESLEAAIRDKQTLALYQGTLTGRDAQLLPALKALITLEKGDYRRNSSVLEATLHNHAPFDIALKNVGKNRFSNSRNIVQVPARGSLVVYVNDVPDKQALTLEFEVLSAYNAPDRHPRLSVR